MPATVERALLGVSAEVARGFTAKAEELTANINQRGTDLSACSTRRPACS